MLYILSAYIISKDNKRGAKPATIAGAVSETKGPFAPDTTTVPAIILPGMMKFPSLTLQSALLSVYMIAMTWFTSQPFEAEA
jgi:hypothetical protein